MPLDDLGAHRGEWGREIGMERKLRQSVNWQLIEPWEPEPNML